MTTNCRCDICLPDAVELACTWTWANEWREDPRPDDRIHLNHHLVHESLGNLRLNESEYRIFKSLARRFDRVKICKWGTELEYDPDHPLQYWVMDPDHKP